ncbi:Acetolactate synthase large subunit [hydrothermal vent metagenome]|uniref:Acetolactate synthase large subunit n=1 Tax=hydrothermal vent metagenome TaxID=652676 RepID=A0A3B0Y3Y5_9ZZZZ
MKASDLFVKCLELEGIEYIFGMPGEENADFMMSLEKFEKIQFILCRHEQGAAFMAEIYKLNETPIVTIPIYINRPASYCGVSVSYNYLNRHRLL